MASQRQHQLDRILDISGPGTYNEEAGRWDNCGTSPETEELKAMEAHDDELRLFIGRAFVKKALKTHQMTEGEFDVATHDSLDPKLGPAAQAALRKKMRQFLISQGVSFVPSHLNPQRIRVVKEDTSGWSFFGFKAKTVEDAEEHLQKWASAILKKDAKAAQSEQKWFNDNGWTALEMKGSPPFYTRMVWKSGKLKKKIGVSITNGTSSLDPPTNV